MIVRVSLVEFLRVELILTVPGSQHFMYATALFSHIFHLPCLPITSVLNYILGSCCLLLIDHILNFDYELDYIHLYFIIVNLVKFLVNPNPIKYDGIYA